MYELLRMWTTSNQSVPLDTSILNVKEEPMSKKEEEKEYPKIRTQEMPNCCTAVVLYGFGETDIIQSTYVDEDEHLPYDELKRQLDHIENVYTKFGYAMLMGFLNDDQVKTKENLEKLGYTFTDFGHSLKHDTQIAMFYKALCPSEDDFVDEDYAGTRFGDVHDLDMDELLDEYQDDVF